MASSLGALRRFWAWLGSYVPVNRWEIHERIVAEMVAADIDARIQVEVDAAYFALRDATAERDERIRALMSALSEHLLTLDPIAQELGRRLEQFDQPHGDD